MKPRVTLHQLEKVLASTPRRVEGFTLLELLVVIAIIIVLLGLSFPAWKMAIDAAHEAKCLGNLHQIGLATAGYISDNEGALPYLGVVDAQGNPFAAPAQLLEPYLNTGANPANFESDQIWICPGDQIRFQRASYYAWNSYGVNQNMAGVHILQVTSITTTMWMADCMGPAGNAPGGCETTVIYDPTFLDNSFTRGRHENRINVLFLDGHTENLTTIPDWVYTSHFWFP